MNNDFINISDNNLRNILFWQNIPSIDDVINTLSKREERYFLNKLLYFLLNNSYEDIKNGWDLFLNCNKHTLDIKIYIAILYRYFSYYTDEKNISNKLEKIYLVFNIDSYYNQDRYQAHFEKSTIKFSDISLDVDKSIKDYVLERIDKNATTLELVVSIYMILCDILRYDLNYTIDRDASKVLSFNLVNRKNNEVVCFTFAIIFKKLLDEFNINAQLVGDEEHHMYVAVQVDNFMINVDSSRSGTLGDNFSYLMADLCNIKVGFPLHGISIAKKWYTNKRFAEFYAKMLDKMVDKCFDKLGYKKDGESKIKSFFTNVGYLKKVYLESYGKSSLEKLQIDVLNQFSSLYKNVDEITRVQLFKKYFRDLFLGDKREIGLVFLYDKDSRRIIKLIGIKGKDRYYMDDIGHFECYNKEQILDVLMYSSIVFKNEEDMDLLNLTNEEKEQLMANSKNNFVLRHIYYYGGEN